jgi:Helix-turn-helix domain
MTGEYLTLSRREVDRLGVIRTVHQRQMKQADAARQLELSVRQVKRLLRCYREAGAAGLVSRHRGTRPNNAIVPATREAMLALVRAHYADFGPTLASEKLLERDGYRVSAETLRLWMIAAGLWRPRQRRQARIHQRRPRRPCRGELVQIDGSPHDWFEGRAPACTLIVFIDDATSELLALRFVAAETTRAYMATLRAYLAEHGRPVALYSDKHSIFRLNHPEREGELTQFSRALKTLDIAAIHANTPQAKGRVERANSTLQDRLVKELRLEGIGAMATANAWLPGFRRRYNQRFTQAPSSPIDAHRGVLHHAHEIKLILSLHHTRTVSKNLTFQFCNREYQIQYPSQGYQLRSAKVTVCEPAEGPVTVLHKGRTLAYRLLAEGAPPVPLDDQKSLHQSVDQAKREQQQRPHHKPRPDHPWRRIPISTNQPPLQP